MNADHKMQCTLSRDDIPGTLPQYGSGYTKQTPWPVVRKRTIPTEQPPLVGEVSAKFCG
jgi:hypothetical protein